MRFALLGPALSAGYIGLALFAGSVTAAEPQQIGGRNILTTVEAHTVKIADDADHLVWAGKSVGSNISTGKTWRCKARR